MKTFEQHPSKEGIGAFQSDPSTPFPTTENFKKNSIIFNQGNSACALENLAGSTHFHALDEYLKSFS